MIVWLFHSDRSERGGGGGCDAVERAVVLPVLEARVLRGGVVEDLRLEARVGRIALGGRAQRDAVVGSRRQQELEAQLEVAELVLGEEVRAAGLADDRGALGTLRVGDLLDAIPREVADPALERRAVEERDEAVGGLLRRIDRGGPGQGRRGRRRGRRRARVGSGTEEKADCGPGSDVHVRKCTAPVADPTRPAATIGLPWTS